MFCGIHGRAQVLSARMARRVVWTAFRDDVLRGAVRLYGRRWHLVAVAVGGRCSDRAARHRWGKIAHVGGGVPCAQVSSSLGVAMFDGESRACPMLPLPLLPPGLPGRTFAGARGLGRSALFNRPWDYIVQRGLGDGHMVRSPTPRQSQLIAAWQLGVPADGCSLLLCNLSRAESIIRRHIGGPADLLNDAVLTTSISVELRDSLGMVYYPGEACHTLTTNAPLSWVGGLGAVGS